jgi:hypothetical protein
MPKPDALELAARFIAALYSATQGCPGRFRSIVDCARRAGIEDPAEITLAWSTAEQAGFLVVHVSDPLVMLTEQGRQAAQPGRASGRCIAHAHAQTLQVFDLRRRGSRPADAGAEAPAEPREAPAVFRLRRAAGGRETKEPQ